MADGAEDYVDNVLAELDDDDDVSGMMPPGDIDDGDGMEEDTGYIQGMMEVGAIDEVGARRLRGIRNKRMRRGYMRKMLKAWSRKARGAQRNQHQQMFGLPSPAFGQSERSTQRRAPLGFVEDGTGAFFFSLAAGPNTTTTMKAKVARAAHSDRLLIVPSAPGVILKSVLVGDEEQLLSAGAPVELYSTAALTDSLPDNFSPLGPALDFSVTLQNTTAAAITGTIGIKASVKR